MPREKVMSKPVRLIILTEYFYPDIASTGQLLTELAIALRDRGCHVAVLTSKPSYAAKRDARQFESYRGLQITRCFRTRFSKNSLLGKVANTVSFFFSVLVRLLFREGDIPLLIVSNPAVLPLVGYVLSVLRGQPYVALVHDIFPDIAVALGYLRPSSLITGCWNVVNQLMLKRAAKVVTLSETMGENLVRKMAIGGFAASDHVVVIHNWADETFIRPIAKAEKPFRSQARISGQVRDAPFRQHRLIVRFRDRHWGSWAAAGDELPVSVHR